jgi:hypothetical protein
MPNYLHLKLPKDFIYNIDSILNMSNTAYGYSVLEPNSIITEKGMWLLKQINVIPKDIILFNNGRANADIDTRIIHTDLYNDGESDQWKRYGFGINLELADTVTNFVWWRMDRCTSMIPNLEAHRQSHYNAPKPVGIVRYQDITGIPDNATRLEEVTFTGPVLVRIDVPHSTTYHTNGNKRVGVGIRFDETTFRSWEVVRKLFLPYAA